MAQWYYLFKIFFSNYLKTIDHVNQNALFWNLLPFDRSTGNLVNVISRILLLNICAQLWESKLKEGEVTLRWLLKVTKWTTYKFWTVKGKGLYLWLRDYMPRMCVENFEQHKENVASYVRTVVSCRLVVLVHGWTSMYQLVAAEYQMSIRQNVSVLKRKAKKWSEF